MASQVFIVGSGPGDPELLTLKAARVIQEAEIILYDKLVNPEILKHASKHCELIYVGKEPGKPCRSQEEINELLVQAAQRKSRVVRLKGGDPFVFGRGGEEALTLKKQGIPYEIIPGISSSIAAGTYAGIPVTHRGISCSFTVITGHESPEKDEAQIPWDTYGHGETLVILMGVGNRKEIARRLIHAGRPFDEPVAFIENGTTQRQKILKTRLGELAETPIEVNSPAVMIVGRVVDLQNDLAWFDLVLKKENPQIESRPALVRQMSF